ncbi:zinc finger protein 888-like [Anopheles maculipalpis]|uniref:zinc finger protein 888-like n=1 Tax=Anopheles maculipalpis TaxID=1496333 RepID=UPI00215975F8|nr:zinc finger protein 888-like [Anopheles maculipalpis]
MNANKDQPVSDEVCLLCQLNSNDRHFLAERTAIGSESIADVICKHFWLSEIACKDRYICPKCWDITFSFHQFYNQIERLHAVQPTVKQEHCFTESKPIDTSEHVDWLQEESTPFRNEIYVKENYTDSDDESKIGQHIESVDRDEESDSDSNIPLAVLKKGNNARQQSNASAAHDKPSPYPGVGLSLCRIKGSTLELMCYDCFRLANNGSKSSAPKVTEERFTFAALLKHYRQEHNKNGYAVCCSRKYTRRRSLKMHLLSHGRTVVYRCIPCGIKFRKQDSLDDHNLLIHTAEEEKRYKCDECDKSFATEHLLQSHGTWHENVAKKNISCKLCNIFFASQPSLEKHRALHHPALDSTETASSNNSGTEPAEDRIVSSQYRTRISATEISEQEQLIKRHCLLNCSRCDYFAENFTSLKQHAIQVHSQRSCDVVCCDRTYSKRQSLYEHCLVHENPDCFRCDVCGKSYSSSRSLQNHKWRIHTPAAQRPFCCDVCGETFVKDYLLKQHLVHHLAKHKKLNHCNVCERSFTTATVLKCHQQTFHGGGFNWICDICAKGFNSRALFENHRLTHSVEGKSQLKHQCEQCKKWLRNKKSYQQHRIRCHTSDGPVTCKFCGKESVNASALKSHIHLHHTSRPEYPCTLCSKSFKTALRLREHEATHTGTILYRCPWCPRTFACGSNMYKHKKAGHPLEWAASVKKRFGER